MYINAKRKKLLASFVLSQALAGCAVERIGQKPVATPSAGVASPTHKQLESSSELQQTAASTRKTEEKTESLFGNDATLKPERVIQLVIERSPTLEQMRATAAAVNARYPQVISLDDPMLNFVTAPGTIGAKRQLRRPHGVNTETPLFRQAGIAWRVRSSRGECRRARCR